MKTYNNWKINIIQKHPRIFEIKKPPQFPFDLWNIEVCEGWQNLILKTANKIQNILDNDKESYFNTLQLKQKFSSLRWYYSCDDKNHDKFNKIIDEAEKESLFICEKCGTEENVSQNKEGYILTLCNTCRLENK